MDSQIALEFVVGTALMVLCVLIHGLGLFALSRLLRTEAAIERMRHIRPLSPRGEAFTLIIVLAMLGLHGLEIWIYTFAYMAVGAVSGLEQALYFSTISYSTVGYSDVHILPEWRLVAAFESILGVFLLGWSTAFFFRLIGRIDPH